MKIEFNKYIKEDSPCIINIPKLETCFSKKYLVSILRIYRHLKWKFIGSSGNKFEALHIWIISQKTESIVNF